MAHHERRKRDEIRRLVRRYPRTNPHKALDAPVRKHVYRLVLQNPGVRVRELARILGVDEKTIDHHVRVLRKLRFVQERRVGQHRHVFRNGGECARRKQLAAALLKQETRRRIVAEVAAHPTISLSTLASLLRKRKSTIEHHVNKLIEAGLLRRRFERRLALDTRGKRLRVRRRTHHGEARLSAIQRPTPPGKKGCTPPGVDASAAAPAAEVNLTPPTRPPGGEQPPPASFPTVPPPGDGGGALGKAGG